MEAASLQALGMNWPLGLGMRGQWKIGEKQRQSDSEKEKHGVGAIK